MARKQRSVAEKPVALAGFRPFSELWQGDGSRFPSEESARWFRRQHGHALAEAGALAFDRGSWLVNLERLDKVRERVALAAAKARVEASV